MKFLPTLLALLLTFSGFCQKNQPAGKLQNGNLNTPDENWLKKAQAYLKESEHQFKQHENSNVFFADNAANHLGFSISEKGYNTSPVKTSEKSKVNNWNQSLSFAGIQKGENKIAADNNFTVLQDKAVLKYKYTDFTIEYINNNNGLRQNFIIGKKPAGNQDLELLLNTNGDLSASILNNGVQFKDSKGAVKLFYTDLNVWDANNNVVSAKMEMRGNSTLAIVVKDQNATYPLTIDPINKTPEWTTSADGVLPALLGQLAVDAAYGFTVAGLGDVNDDGFDDVAIGSPAAADVLAGTGTLAAVGAVFVYYGSLNGLPTTPSAVLQPTTAVAGALFGYSIAGGDINNDGKNDIIIGAPLDRVTISIGGGNTATGTVGKVYAYNGATLTTGVTPLLSLQLDGNGILQNGLNLSVNALFGFSVAVTEDLNNDNKRDIIVGAPTYAGIKTDILNNQSLDVKSGGAFIFLSSGATHTLVKLNPMTTGILGLPILTQNIAGLLFGYSVDGAGDYNSDGKNDVVVTAPAGVNLSSLGAILNNKLLQGSATVYYGTASGIDVDPGATLVATSGGLLTNIVGTISNIANMFGLSVKGVKNASGARNGNLLVGAPLGGDIMNVLTLQLKTGTVSVFKKKASSPSGDVIPNQVLASPRNDNNVLQLIQSNLLFGYSLDNTLDINCDGNTDIIVGEPASSGLQLLNTSVAGGAAYIYLGKSDGTYETTPFWTFTATEDAFLGVNGTSLIGYSVAGVGRTRGNRFGNKILVGTPSRTLDFGSGLLNLGGTLGNIFSLTSGDNGVGKSFVFDMLSPCVGMQATNPDINSTFVNVSVAGNTNTNDNVPLGSTYGTPVLVSGTSGAVTSIVINSNGTYTFVSDKAGVYVYNVPVCVPSQASPCPTTRLVVTVLEPTISNNPPVADVDLATTKLNTAVTIKTLANDAAGNVTTSLSASSTTVIIAPLHGTTSVNSATGDITYTPANNYTGTDTLTYQVCDNQSPSQCATARQIITTLPAASSNTTTATDDYLIVQANTPAAGNVKTNDIDAEGDIQTVATQTSNVPGKGTLILLSDGSYIFTPQTGFWGPVDFVYSTCDNGTPSVCAAATLHLLVRQELPYTNPDFNSTFVNTNTPGNVSTNDKVPSGTTYGTPVAASGPSGSTAIINMNSDGTYTFKTDVPGVYVYDVPVCYPQASTAPCPSTKLTITVLNGTVTNNAPVANVDIASTKINTAVTIKTLANDAASYSSNALVPSSVAILTAPLHGTTTINSTNGDVTYTPATGYVGSDTLTYQVCDNQFPSKCATAKQVITILATTAANRTTAADDYLITRVNTPANGNVKTNDTDPEGNTQTVTAQTTNYSGRGILQLNADGTYTFTPDTGFTGPADFIYTTCDDGNPQACATATLHVLIQPTFGLPDLTPTIFNDSTNLVKTTTRDNAIRIMNIGSGPTTAPIIFTIPKMLPSFEITIDANATFMNVAGGTAVTNANWTIVEQTNRYVFTSKPGLVLQVGDLNMVGVKVKAIGAVSSTGNLSVQIILGTGGGETPFNNNNHNNTYTIK